LTGVAGGTGALLDRSSIDVRALRARNAIEPVTGRHPTRRDQSPGSRIAAALLASIVAVAAFLFVEKAFRPSARPALAGPAAAASAGLIAYAGGTSGGPQIFTMRPDGSGRTALTGVGPASPSSPGSRILFTRGEGFETYAQDVYVMNADGSNEQRLTSWPGFDSFPVWSPDGSWIAFASDRDASPEQRQAIQADGAFTNISMYVMRADGSDVERVFTAGDNQALLPGSWRA
jgi:Tol biopolymer transport system component